MKRPAVLLATLCSVALLSSCGGDKALEDADQEDPKECEGLSEDVQKTLGAELIDDFTSKLQDKVGDDMGEMTDKMSDEMDDLDHDMGDSADDAKQDVEVSGDTSDEVKDQIADQVRSETGGGAG